MPPFLKQGSLYLSVLQFRFSKEIHCFIAIISTKRTWKDHWTFLICSLHKWENSELKAGG